MDTMKTGGYLAALRKGAGMTQQEAADRLGVSNKTISKWESGGGFPDIAILPALAELYGVTADDILAGETVRRTAASGGGQVEQYLAHRGELRWRIGYAVAMLCLLTAVLFHGYGWSFLPIAAAAAALWIGWSACSGEGLRRRVAMLLPCAVLLVWFGLTYFRAASRLATALMAGYDNGNSVVYRLADMLRWDLLLLLLPLVYGLLRCAAVRWFGQRCLLSKPYFRVVAAIWLAALAEEVVHWIVALPPTLAYAATNYPSYFQRYEALLQDYAPTLNFLYVPGITAAVTVLALLITAVIEKHGKREGKNAVTPRSADDLSRM